MPAPSIDHSEATGYETMADMEVECDDIRPGDHTFIVRVVDEWEEPIKDTEFVVSVDGGAEKAFKSDGFGIIKVPVRKSTKEITLKLKTDSGDDGSG